MVTEPKWYLYTNLATPTPNRLSKVLSCVCENAFATLRASVEPNTRPTCSYTNSLSRLFIETIFPDHNGSKCALQPQIDNAWHGASRAFLHELLCLTRLCVCLAYETHFSAQQRHSILDSLIKFSSAWPARYKLSFLGDSVHISLRSRKF